jgi:ribonucleotide reductase beta subunit family protein with ferritin-like domain
MSEIKIANYDPEDASTILNTTLTEVEAKIEAEEVSLKIQSIISKNNFVDRSNDWLLDDIDDYSFLPIKRPALIKHYYDQRSGHWVPTDVDMRGDRNDFYSERCTEGIRTFVKGLFAFFVPADGLVGENIFENFQKDTSFWKESRYFYAEQASMEVIHGEMYSLMAQVIIRDKSELDDIFNSVRTYPAVKRISEFMKKYMDRSYSLQERIIAFACIEGVLFNSAFAAIYWIKKRNILRGLCKANEFIARDEAIHTRFAVTLYLMITQRQQTPPALKDRVTEIIQEAVNVNEQFMKEILVVELIGMSTNEIMDYTKCTADALSVAFGYPKIYNVNNPFDWMAVISLPNKTNFFEDKVSEYSQKSDGEFIFDEDAYF